ncbi:SDR family oxidoreductase [Propionivibrio sp.]|uniref:SDR family oxidoreductase n=1 Tax=Propionivibrio sp. TaxID=2212460 RepID=UPI00272E2A03|nr:SDR family oxidoreductase [Propionivibrio sp.]
MFRERLQKNNNRDEQDIAGAYLFLASALSVYVTGAVMDVNGGMLIHGREAEFVSRSTLKPRREV